MHNSKVHELLTIRTRIVNKSKIVHHFCAVTFRITDEVNLRILDILSRDASRPFVNIAKELEISDASVHIRVKRLQAAGILRKFTITTDNALLGYDHLAFIGINISKGCGDEVLVTLSQLDEILELHEMYGQFDLLVKLRARSLEEMRDIIVNKISSIPQITEAKLMTVLRTIKEEHMISLKRDIVDTAGPAAAAT
jgi:Lrp/AsnC family transcriptional regulator, regulator for asnA, asnC and gidA